MSYTISRKSWHWKLYALYLRLAGRHWEARSLARVCLCPYVRAITIWLPLRFTFIVLLPLATLTTIAYLLGRFSTVAGWKYFLSTLAWTVGAFLCLLAAGFFIEWLVKFFREREPSREPSSVVGQWFKAKHEKICPCFEVKD